MISYRKGREDDEVRYPGDSKDAKEVTSLLSSMSDIEVYIPDMIEDCYMAYDGKKLVGVGFMHEGQCEDDDFTMACSDYNLHSFGIHIDYRRRGIGTMLFKNMLRTITFYKGSARIEFIVQRESVEFWKEMVKDMEAVFMPIKDAHNEDLKKEEGMYSSYVMYGDPAEYEENIYLCYIIIKETDYILQN